MKVFSQIFSLFLGLKLFSDELFGPKNSMINSVKIYIEEREQFGNCVSCNCKHDLEAMVHCVIENSGFLTNNKADSTFIFVPQYLDSRRNQGFPNIPASVRGDEQFQLYKGAKHLFVDGLVSFKSFPGYLEFNDERIVITPNLTTSFIRKDRWKNSRHIQIPTMQSLEIPGRTMKKHNTVFFGLIEGIENDIASIGAKVITDSSIFFKEIASSNFTVFRPSIHYHPSLIYDIIRCGSIPVLISDPYLPAYANSHIDYNKISIRIPFANISSLKNRIDGFNVEKAMVLLGNASKFLTWPQDGIPRKSNAAGVLLEYLGYRHHVIRPVLRRTFIGTNEIIDK